MTILRILSVVGLCVIAGPVYADAMPFFGANPSEGSYWTVRDTNISQSVRRSMLWREAGDPITGHT